MVTPLPSWMTVAQAANHADVSTWTIRNEIKLGHLRARRVGRIVRILEADLAAWMRGDEVFNEATTGRDVSSHDSRPLRAMKANTTLRQTSGDTVGTERSGESDPHVSVPSGGSRPGDGGDDDDGEPGDLHRPPP